MGLEEHYDHIIHWVVYSHLSFGVLSDMARPYISITPNLYEDVNTYRYSEGNNSAWNSYGLSSFPLWVSCSFRMKLE